MEELRTDIRKLKAVALPLALTFSLLFVIMTISIIAEHSNLSRQLQDLEAREKLIRRATETEYDILNNKFNSISDTCISMIDEQTGDSVTIIKDHWGIFERYTYRVTQRSSQPVWKRTLSRSFIVAVRDPGTAMIRAQGNISLCGNLKLSGDFYINGKIIRSRQEGAFLRTPDLNELRQHKLSDGEKTLGRSEWLARMTSAPQITEYNSSNKVKMISYDHDQVIKGLRLSGPAVICSSGKLVIDSSCNLHDVIIRAQEIEISHGFKGSVQCFAEKAVIMKAHVSCEFPSALIVNCRNGNGIISIEDKAEVKGIVCMNVDRANKASGVINIQPRASVYGDIVTNGILVSSGKIEGAIDTEQIASLKNGQINVGVIEGGILNIKPYYSLLTRVTTQSLHFAHVL